jgi:hypothetical protein
VTLLAIEKKILDRLDAGLPDGRRRYSADHTSDRAAWRLVQAFAPRLDDRQAQKLIDEFLKQKTIRVQALLNFTRDDIIAGFHRMAKRAHPDVGGSAELFRKLVEARV